MDNPKAGGRLPTMVSERAKIAVMGVVLALMLLAIFWPDRTNPDDQPVNVRPAVVDVEPFELDPQILAEIKDATAVERGERERRPWSHLLEKSYNLSSAAATVLDLPDAAANIPTLRANPSSHRGDLIWVKGRLEEFKPGIEHPIRRALAYEGRLRTADGEHVIFWVSKPLPEAVQAEKDPWVRVEGFFMKITDQYRNPDADILGAPVIVGPRVYMAYPDWHAVDKLDPTVLARVANAVWIEEEERWENDTDMRTMMVESQDVPLWHIASYAIRHFEQVAGTDQHFRNIFELIDQYKKFRTGGYEQGSSWRLRGTFMTRRTYHAAVNPVGIKYWSEVWLRIPRMGSKLIPIWVPRDVGDWRFGETVDVDGFFFKNYGYEAVEGQPVHTPLFVAGGLERYELKTHPLYSWIGLGFAIFVALMAFLFFSMNRRAKRESEEYKAKLVERRRNRRTRTLGRLA